MIKITREDFLADKGGRRYRKSVESNIVDFSKIFDFFNSPVRQQRLVDSQLCFNMPALTGVVIELDRKFPELAELPRHRQAIGVIVRMIMEQKDWIKTGKKGSLRAFSKSFSVSEIYVLHDKE